MDANKQGREGGGDGRLREEERDLGRRRCDLDSFDESIRRYICSLLNPCKQVVPNISRRKLFALPSWEDDISSFRLSVSLDPLSTLSLPLSLSFYIPAFTLSVLRRNLLRDDEFSTIIPVVLFWGGERCENEISR